jgi:hypothetical protein
MNEQMTVRQLLMLCIQECAKGNADKRICISDDNEGNGYHGMFYGFTDAVEMDTKMREYDDNIESLIYDSRYKKAEDIIIFG